MRKKRKNNHSWLKGGEMRQEGKNGKKRVEGWSLSYIASKNYFVFLYKEFK